MSDYVYKIFNGTFLFSYIFLNIVIVIMQWVIFAIRNLCENNLKNQEIIAGLHKEGTVSSSTLEEMGLTLHDGGDNSIKIVPLESLHR